MTWPPDDAAAPDDGGVHTLEQLAVAEYYRQSADALAKHLDGRKVHAGGWTTGQRALSVAPRSAAEVLREVEAGARWFCWETGGDTPSSIQLTVGTGTDIATAATAALAIIDAVVAAGSFPVPATDGEGGLLIFVTGLADLSPLAVALAERAPEIATTDAAAADGRAWLATSGFGSLVPAPYSLVDSADGTGVVLPLTVDELAAVTAGMPLDPRAGDVADRLALHGDLAGSLIGR